MFTFAQMPVRPPFRTFKMATINYGFVISLRQLTYLCWVAFDEAKKHTPTLTRQWLKDQILSELPTVKSVRQKDRRKPSILYCPEACEEDMIHSSLKQNVASEMENTVMIHKTAKLIRKSITKFAGEEEADA